jgi:phenylalanyl-tRNA synthetase beta chain
MSREQLEDKLFLLKAEVEGFGEDTIDIEINPDRQDMLSTEGVARALRAFLDINPGFPKFPVRNSCKKIVVKKGLDKIRKYISCGIVKGVETSDQLIKEYMRLQEMLTSTHGRNRRKASIGLYVYDDLKFPIYYKTELPERIEFVPLGHDERMDGPTILQRHEKGVEFGPIISGFERWPLLVDSGGKILSLPPIINSNDLGRISEDTHNIFVEVTGTHLPTVEQCLNIMTTSLAERGGKIESVEVSYPNGPVVQTPELTPREMEVDVEEIRHLLGLDVTYKEIEASLKRMCYGAKVSKGTAKVKVPAFRVDILHPWDIIEDVAIGYGFDNIDPTLPGTMTVGGVRPMTRLKNKTRELMVGTGFQEIMSYIMTSPEVLNEKMERTTPYVGTANPKSRDFSVLRNSLLPVLLDFAGRNQHADYPQKVFEVGDIVLPDKDEETRTQQLTSLCALITNTQVDVTELLRELAFVLRGLGLEGRFKFQSSIDSCFIDGRAARILVDKKDVGIVGEVSPTVLTNFEIGSPVVAFEMLLAQEGTYQKPY